MADSEWKKVVEGYVQSIWKDGRIQRERALAGAEQSFLSEFAIETVHRARAEWAQEKIDSLPPPADESYWSLVEDSEQSKLVEIAEGDSCINENILPFMKTRLRLEQTNAGWRIVNVFEPCTGCSVSKDNAGKCFACKGEGEVTVRLVRRFPWVKRTRVAGGCNFCDGKGNCLNCVEEEMPGWRSTVFRRPYISVGSMLEEKGEA